MKLDEQLLPPVAIDGSWRVDPGARLVIARNKEGFEDLQLRSQSTIAIYSSFSNKHLKSMLKHSLRWIKKQSESVIHVDFDRFSLLDNLSPTLSTTADLLVILESLIDYGQKYIAELKRASIISSPNGKFVVPIIPISHEELSEPQISKKLLELVEISKVTPIVPILVIDNPRRLHPTIQRLLSWQAFLGKELEAYSRDKYMEEFSVGMKSRVPIGVTVNRVTDSYKVINSLNYEPTENALNLKNAITEDTKNYRDFLKGLTDGKS